VAGGGAKAEILQAFVADPSWVGKPCWMLSLLRFGEPGAGGRDYVERLRNDVLPKLGGRVVLSGYARTVVGRGDFHHVLVAEYPSPQAFVQAAKALPDPEEQIYLVPLRPGWFNIGRLAPAPSKPFTAFTAENVWAIPSGMVGPAAEGARVGETSASRSQAEAFATDERLAGARRVLWHLNLLRFADGHGQETYGRYARAMGGKNGVLSLFGARSTLANDCYRSLAGDVDFHQAIIAEYPCRDSFFSMGASEEYLKTAHFRHKGLEETYIISCVPEYLDTGLSAENGHH